MIDSKLYSLGKKIFKINRSITGDGVRKTLAHIKKEKVELKYMTGAFPQNGM